MDQNGYKEIPKEELLHILVDIHDQITHDESMEGYVRWEWGDKPGTYNVQTFYRINNKSGGQGGAILIQGDIKPFCEKDETDL